MLGQTSEAIAAIEGSLARSRESRTGLEHEPLRLAALSEALLSAGHYSNAVEAANKSVALSLQRGTDMYLPVCYRALAEALLAAERPVNIEAVKEALENATVAVEATGARGELPFIARARQLLPVGG
jgi:hypothetical protein